MKANIFEKHQRLVDKGIVITVEPINQIENGQKSKVQSGEIPLVTFTGYILDTNSDVLEYGESCDTFQDAFEKAIQLGEKINRGDD